MRVESGRRFRDLSKQLGNRSHRSSKRLVALSAAVAGVTALAGISRADTFANNGGLDLSLSTSWIDLTVPATDFAPPTTNDIAQWDINSAGGTFALNAADPGTTTSWLGISILNPTAAVTIGGDIADTLSLGASGINMSAATQSLTFNDLLSLSSNQTWNVASGQTLTIASFSVNPTGITTNLNGDTLTITGAGNTVFGTSNAYQSSGTAGVGNAPVVTANTNSIIGSGNIIENGTGSLTLSSANNAINSVTVNNGTLDINMSAATANGASTPVSVSVGTLVTGGGTILTVGGSRLSGSSGDFAYQQTINALTVGAGESNFVQTRGSSGRTIDIFSTITRQVGATADFTDALNSNGTDNSNSGGYRAKNANDGAGNAVVNGIIPYITYTTGGTNAAVSTSWFAPSTTSPGTSNAGTAYSAFLLASAITGSSNSTSNVSVDTGSTTAALVLPANTTLATLYFNNNANSRVITNSGTLTVDAGGILVTNNMGSHSIDINGGTLEGGNPGGGSGDDLIFIDMDNPTNGSKAIFTIESLIADNNTTNPGATALTKSGIGSIVLNDIANTYTGGTFLNSGIIQIAGEGASFGSLGAVPVSPVANNLTFAGGTLQLGATFNVNSNRGFTLSPKGGTFDTNGFSSTYGGIITGSGPFTKAGANTLRLASANTYTGNTTISLGTLSAVNTSGSATGSGNVTVNSAGFLSGSGTVSGAVTLTTNATAGMGGHVAPGDNGVGTLNVGAITFNAGSAADIEASTDSSYDVLNVTGTNGLTINGGGINFYTAGTTSPYGSTGTHTYDIIEYQGSLNGAATNLQILNPEPSGFTYTFGTAVVGGNNFITLTTTGTAASVVSNWTSTGSPNANWSTVGNWSAGVPQHAGDSATFPNTADLATTVTLDTAESVGILNFNNTSSYTIQGSATLTLDSGLAGTAATISDLGGTHFVNVPTTLNSNTVINVANAVDTLTLGGNIGGNGNLTIGTGGVSSGTGMVILTGAANTYGGTTAVTTINSGTLQLGSTTTGTGSLGGSSGTSGTTVVDNGTLKFNLAGSYAFSGTINGTGNVVQSGAGTTTLNSANTYQGGTTISNGTLQLGNATALGTGAVTLNSPGILDVNGTGPTVPGVTGSGTINNTNASPTTISFSNTGSALFTGVIENTGGLVSVVMQGTGTQTLNGPDTYGGNTTINAGTLSINSAASLGTSTNPITINAGGTLDINTGFSSSRGITLGGTANATPASIAVDSGQIFTFAGALTGSFFNKNGPGTLVLTGTNSPSSNTQVSGGVLDIEPGSTFSGSTAEVDGASTQNLLINGGTFTLTGTLTLTGAGANSVTINNGSIVNLGGVGQGSSANEGPFTINGGTVSLGNFAIGRSATGSDFTKGLIITNGTVTATSVTIANANSWGNMAVSGGTTTISGAFILGAQATSGRGGGLQVTNGTLTSTDPGGLQMSTVAGNASTASFTGGTTSLNGISMFPGGIATGTATVTIGGTNGGALYLGSGGILADTSGGSKPTVSLTGGNLVLGATANWTSAASVPFTITNNPTIQAADSSGNPFNIDIAGAISGDTGGFTKTGGGTLTLGGVDSHSQGNDEVNQGTLAIDVGGSLTGAGIDVNSGGALTILAQTAGTAPLARSIPAINLNGGNGSIALAPAPQNTNRSVLVTLSLNVNSNTFDMTNNDMILTSGGAGLATITQEIAQGRNGGTSIWSGTAGGITSSAAAATPTKTALGVILNDDPNNPGHPLVTTFDGQPTSDGDVLVKYTFVGDANLDGVINATDYMQIDNGFSSQSGGSPLSGWINGDFNYDGKINGDDYTLIDNAFNTQGSTSFASVSAGPANMIAGNTDQIAGAGISAVPEPATLGLLSIAAMGMVGRRKRRTR
jgi:fibronectin-binding autotransporter adhesin